MGAVGAIVLAVLHHKEFSRPARSPLDLAHGDHAAGDTEYAYGRTRDAGPLGAAGSASCASRRGLSSSVLCRAHVLLLEATFIVDCAA